MQGDERILVIFDFDTGDADCKYYTIPAVVYGGKDDIASLEDGITSYFDSPASEDASFEDAVHDVLTASGLRWEYVGYMVPCCRDLRIIHI